MSGQSNKSIKEHIDQSIDISNGDKNKNLSVLKLFANYPISSRSQQPYSNETIISIPNSINPKVTTHTKAFAYGLCNADCLL